jgi:phosphoglycerol geranylgeranyltransferase
MKNYFNQTTRALAVLIDPDKSNEAYLTQVIENDEFIDFYFVGGSLVTNYRFDEVISFVKKHSSKPVIIFPGSGMHISSEADVMLFLSLISGRNPEYLIGQQVLAAPIIKAANLSTISTGYMLIDGGNVTTASYMSNTLPIPSDKIDIAVCTALAGEMLGMQCLFMDGGSGAKNTVSEQMIKQVKASVDLPVIVGGGIRTPHQARAIWDAGADVVVVGTVIEENVAFLKDFR